MKFITMLLLTMFTMPALASRYSYLEQDFASANERIKLSEFREYLHPSNPKCTEFTKEEPRTEKTVFIGTVSAEDDAMGPVPPMVTTRLAFTEYEGANPIGFIDQLKLDEKPTELIVALGDSYDLTIRKKKDPRDANKFIYPFKRTLKWKETVRNPTTDKEEQVDKSADRFGVCFF